MPGLGEQSNPVSHKPDLSTPAPPRAWTTADDYLGAMARRRTARRARAQRRRTQPETPRLMLSTLPFLAIMVGLAILSLAIMIAAFPGAQPRQQPRASRVGEQGVAPKGWFQEAQREFHR